MGNSNLNAVFLNLAIQSPSLELGLSVTDFIQNESPKNHQNFYICKGALQSCSVNITNSKSICNSCYHKALKGFDVYQKKNNNSKKIIIKKSDLKIYNNKEISNKIEDKLLLGVNSTVASQQRIDDMSLLDSNWKSYHSKLLLSSKQLYFYFKEELRKFNYQNIIVFNGRLACSRAITTVASEEDVNFVLYDAHINGKRPIVSFNQMFHSLEFAHQNSLKSYLENLDNSKEIAENYMLSKLNRVVVNDKVYTNHQEKSFVPEYVEKSKLKIISIFTSSDDEYKYIGADWKNHVIVNQVDAINAIIKSKLNEDFLIVVKMHPNQKHLHKSTLLNYQKISDSINVMFPEDKTDTYELIRKSEYIINFCSSIGAEANYLRKKVVQIGPSLFCKLPAANYVRTPQEAVELILNKKAKLMPIRASIIWFVYLTKYEFKLPAYNYIKNGLVHFNNQKISIPLIQRIKMLPPKIYSNVSKGNFDFLTNFFFYFRNFIKGENKVK